MSKHTIAQIAESLQAVAVGDTAMVVDGVGEPGSAGAGDLAVAMSPDYAADLAGGKAKAAILWDGADWRALNLEAAILVRRPRLAMAHLTALMHEKPGPEAGIHATAVIDPGADIPDTAMIGPYTVIGAGVSLGENARIGAHVTIAPGVVIGDNAVLDAGVHIGPNVRIGANFAAHSGVVLGADGFSYVTPEPSAVEAVRDTLSDAPPGGDAAPSPGQPWIKIHSLGGVKIGDNVEIGANSNVDAGTIRATEIGDGTKLDALVQVGHNVRVGRDCLLCAHVAVGGSAVLGNNVVLGGQAGVADNISLGDGVIAGGATKILSNVPAGRAVLGYPAMRIDRHVETYKALRRLPRILERLSGGRKTASKWARKKHPDKPEG